MSDSEIKITEWLSANSNPGPSGFKAISVASSASGQGQENQGPKGKIEREMQHRWERKGFWEGCSGLDIDSGLRDPSLEVLADVL